MKKEIPIKAFIRIKPLQKFLEYTNTTVKIQKESGEECEYSFDKVFGPKSDQKNIYKSFENIVENLLSGKSITIFCYGNTGAGKTYTMVGDKKKPGLVYNILKDILVKSTAQVSYLEIYNEKVYDLLEPKEVILREIQGKINIPCLFERNVSDISTFEKIFDLGNKNRTTASTKLNSNSSRSHSVLRVCVGESKLFLIDLAGSENNKRTGNEGIRLTESNNINKSLFVLGKVVNAILKNMQRIPYRDSKLTRLLQDSLGGSNICYIIGNVVDDPSVSLETINTLSFAAKARKIVNKITDIKLLKGYEITKKQGQPVSNKFTKLGFRCNSASKQVFFVDENNILNDPFPKKDLNFHNIECNFKNSSKRPSLIEKTISSTKLKVYDVKNLKTINLTKKNSHDFTQNSYDVSEEFVDGKKKKKEDSTFLIKSSMYDRPDIILTPNTMEKSYKAFIKRAENYEKEQKYKLALEDYKTIQKFCDTDYIQQKINSLMVLKRKPNSKKIITKEEILNILNSGNFLKIKKLPKIGDKRAQAIVDFVLGGNTFDALDDLKLVFNEKIVESIVSSVE